MITSIEEIKKRVEKDIELAGWGDGEPFIAKLKQVSMFSLVSKGKIPNSLLGTAMTIFEGKKSGNVGTGDNGADIAQMASIIDLMCEAAMVEPTFADVGDYLTDNQKSEIFNYTQGGLTSLNSFRKK